MSRPCSLNVRLHGAWWGQVNNARWGIEAIRAAKSVGVNAFWQTTKDNVKQSLGARDDPKCVKKGSLWEALLLETESGVQSPMPESYQLTRSEDKTSPRTPPRRWRRRMLGKQALLCGESLLGLRPSCL